MNIVIKKFKKKTLVSSIFNSLITCTTIILLSVNCNAQLLSDYNGDQVISLTAFGDSITYGYGDGGNGFAEIAPRPAGPAGYPPKLAQYLGVPVRNAGVPGELLTEGGFSRFANSIQSSASDVVIILEGTNDVTVQASQTEYRRKYQQMINVAIATNRLPLLITLPPPCCNISPRRPPTRSYNDIIKNRANVNSLPLIDIARVWDNNCPGSGSCDLYTQPEGLHPSSKGYTAMAQAVSATLLGIDIFSPKGPKELEDALGLEPGSVVIIPDVEPVVMP